jgi:hypothetical protein
MATTGSSSTRFSQGSASALRRLGSGYSWRRHVWAVAHEGYGGQQETGYLIQNGVVILEGDYIDCKTAQYVEWPEMENIGLQHSQSAPSGL